MLLAFSCESSNIVDSTLNDFVDPPGTISRITHLWLYGNVKVFRLDNVVLIKTDGMLELFSKYALISFFMISIIGYIINSSFLVWANLPFMLLALIIISPRLHLNQLFREFRRRGFKGKLIVLDFLQAKSRFNYVSRTNC